MQLTLGGLGSGFDFAAIFDAVESTVCGVMRTVLLLPETAIH